MSQPVGQTNLDVNNNESTDSTKETNKVSYHTVGMAVAIMYRSALNGMSPKSS